MTKNPHCGSTLNSWLQEEGILEEVTAAAQKKVIAWQIEQLMAKLDVSKTELAKRMKTSRAAVDRLLDPSNASVTLYTLNRAATALGQRVSITFETAAWSAPPDPHPFTGRTAKRWRRRGVEYGFRHPRLNAINNHFGLSSSMSALK